MFIHHTKIILSIFQLVEKHTDIYGKRITTRNKHLFLLEWEITRGCRMRISPRTKALKPGTVEGDRNFGLGFMGETKLIIYPDTCILLGHKKTEHKFGAWKAKKWVQNGLLFVLFITATHWIESMLSPSKWQWSAIKCSEKCMLAY